MVVEHEYKAAATLIQFSSAATSATPINEQDTTNASTSASLTNVENEEKSGEQTDKEESVTIRTDSDVASATPASQQDTSSKTTPEHLTNVENENAGGKLTGREEFEQTQKRDNGKRPAEVDPTDRNEVQNESSNLVVCGNCRSNGHELQACAGPVDQYGYIDGCPLCNSVSHTLFECLKMGDISRDDLYNTLVFLRHGKPPIRSLVDFRTIKPDEWLMNNNYRTQSSQFALHRFETKGRQLANEEYSDPRWDQMGRPLQATPPQEHPLDALRKRNEDRVLRMSGRRFV